MTQFFFNLSIKRNQCTLIPAWMTNDLVLFCESNGYSSLQLSDLNPCSYNVFTVLLLGKNRECNQLSLVLEQMTLSQFFFVKQKHTTQPVQFDSQTNHGSKLFLVNLNQCSSIPHWMTLSVLFNEFTWNYYYNLGMELYLNFFQIFVLKSTEKKSSWCTYYGIRIGIKFFMIPIVFDGLLLLGKCKL